LGYYFGRLHRAPAGSVACTLEAKLCPDGSYVGRIGPDCRFAACPEAEHYTITAADSGGAFSYPVTSRFLVELDSSQYDPAMLSCAPAGIIGEVSNTPSVQAPLFVKNFEAVAPGECTLRDGSFSARIVVTAETASSTPGSAAPVAGEGEHCGGFIQNAPVCAAGFHCKLGAIPDTGGTCVAD
jgi:hypothetical protein